MKYKVLVGLLVAGVLGSGAAQAALYDRGGGLLYDDVLNVTWLQDANYAQTSGYDSNGRMTWGAANAWAANLVLHDSVRNVDYSDWRLASNSPVNGTSWNYSMTYDGSTDDGYNITSPQAELSYMFYVNLGLSGYLSSTGANQPIFGVFGDGSSSGQRDIGLVKNLQAWIYWYGTSGAPVPSGYSPSFSTITGFQGYFYQPAELSVWAVRDGDVAAVPLPGTFFMMLSGLGFLGGVGAMRRKRSDPQSVRGANLGSAGLAL